MLDLCMNILESGDNGEITESVANDLYFILLESSDIKSQFEKMKNLGMKIPKQYDLTMYCVLTEQLKKDIKNFINDDKTLVKTHKLLSLLIECLMSLVLTGTVTASAVVLADKKFDVKTKIITIAISLLIEVSSILIIIMRRKKLASNEITHTIQIIEKIDRLLPKIENPAEKNRIKSVRDKLNDYTNKFILRTMKNNTTKESVNEIKLRIYEENISGNISDDERDLLLEMVVIK